MEDYKATRDALVAEALKKRQRTRKAKEVDSSAHPKNSLEVAAPAAPEPEAAEVEAEAEAESDAE